MSIRKFATATILEAQMGGDAGFAKSSHRAVFSYVPEPGYLYVRSRAISSRCNDNYDMFPAEEIEKSYMTFIGKPVFVNHHNEDHRRMRGVIIDAALHRDKNPDGSPDTWVELLHKVDAVTFPKLAKAILAKEVNRTSMGCDVQFSKCSICNNVATSPLEYCAHIPGKKGKRIAKPSTDGRTEARLVFEICSGLSFFENSLLVEQPADPTAYFLGDVEYGPGLESMVASVQKTAGLFPSTNMGADLAHQYGYQHGAQDRANGNDHSADERLNSPDVARLTRFRSERKHYIKGYDEGFDSSNQKVASKKTAYYEAEPRPGSVFHRATPTAVNEAYHVHEVASDSGFDSGFVPTNQGIHVHDYPQAIRELRNNWQIHDDNMQDDWNPDKKRDSLRRREVGKLINSLEERHRRESTWQRTASKNTNSPTSPVWSLIKQAEAEERVTTTNPPIWDLIKEADRIGDDLDNDLREEDPRYWDRLGSVQPPTSNWRFRAHVAKLHDDRPYVPTVVPSKPIEEMNDEEKTAHKTAVKAHAADWMARNPMHPQNVVDHWNAATPEEKENGKNWYQDAHHTARIIAQGTNTPMHAMAGLVSTYSPQTHWATNMITSAKAARLKVGLGGKGNKHGEPVNGVAKGIMAGESQRQTAEKLVNAPHDEDEARAQGSHYEQLLKGPKTQAFARLIHNGGDDHSVVVDRHAFSVASGARASDAAYGHSGLGGKRRYNEASDVFRQAAHTISQQEGETIHPHQVQAATWLVRQRLNEQGNQDLIKKSTSSASAARRAIGQMTQYMGEHHPEASIQMPGTGYSKETGLAKEDLSPKRASQGSPNFTALAYGETKAPRDVDTLRQENCVVCGNSSAFDGVQCQVCGYIAPPRPFGDPDTDVAKDNDLRKQVVDGTQADPSDPDQQLGNQIGNPEILDEQAADAETAGVQPALTCGNCGTGIVPQPPTTDSGEPPYPAEGDVCPVCKKGELLSDQDPSEDADQDGVPDAEEQPAPDADSDDDDDDDSSDDDDDDKKKKPVPPKGK